MEYRKFRSQKYPKLGEFIDDCNYRFITFFDYTLYFWKRDLKIFISNIIFKITGKCVRHTWYCHRPEWKLIEKVQDSRDWQMKRGKMRYYQNCVEKCELCKRTRNVGHYE